MIKLLCSDVDGVMTDNKLHVSATGELFKTFNARDGWALKEILPKNGIEPAVITGRKSQIVPKRCEELGVSLVFAAVTIKTQLLLSSLKKRVFLERDCIYW